MITHPSYAPQTERNILESFFSSFNFFNATMEIYVLQLFIAFRPSRVILMNQNDERAKLNPHFGCFDKLFRLPLARKGSNNRRIRQNSNHKPVIYVHLSNAKKKLKLKASSRKIRKKRKKNVC